jgi:ankyrin repeat protein
MTLLNFAAERGNKELVTLLLDCGANINKEDWVINVE